MAEDYAALVARLRSRDAEEMLVRDPRQAADVIEKLSDQILIDGRKDGEGIEYQARAVAAEADLSELRLRLVDADVQIDEYKARLARAEDCIEKIRYGSIPAPIAIANYKKVASDDKNGDKK